MFNEPTEKSNLPFVSVDYDEFHPETYRGIIVKIEGEQDHVINTGEFQRDYNRVMDEYTPFMKSSTVDNYISDSTL